MSYVRREINKIAIIGKGTAGCMASSFFTNYHPAQIDWYYDPDTPAQSVGEGSTLPFPTALFNELNIGYASLEVELRGSIKKGIRKIGYGGIGDYLHEFPLGRSGVHFSADALQNLVPKILQQRGINIIEERVKSHDDIDADYIIDCSGKPNDFKEFHQAEYVLVNATLTEQFPCQGPLFDFTLTVARPYGWVFAIPLRDRVSIGYLYNDTLNSLDEVKVDMEAFKKEYRFENTTSQNAFTFNNYYRKNNFTDRVAYNGNASFFLEPLEATSVGMIEQINKYTDVILKKDFPIEAANSLYLGEIRAIEHMIMLHYYAGSKYDTPFWDLAKERGLASTKQLVGNNTFKTILSQALTNFTKPHFNELLKEEYGQWPAFSYLQNLKGLGITQRVDDLVKEYDELNK